MAKEIETYRQLKVWVEAMDLVEDIYMLTKNLPSDELYGLRSQIRRAVVSIPSNIAEGHGRRGNKEFLHHLSIAKGSLSELETQLILCARLSYISREDLKPVWDRAQTVSKMLSGLIKALMK
ncbi:MAG: four helix bundle protein [Candidatus Kapaibacterium sp.]